MSPTWQNYCFSFTLRALYLRKAWAVLFHDFSSDFSKFRDLFDNVGEEGKQFSDFADADKYPIAGLDKLVFLP